MDVEPGEQVLFCGHPSWRARPGMWVRGAVVALLAGVIAGIATIVVDGHVEALWVAAAVVAVFAWVMARAQLRSLRTRYTITDRRLAVETGLVSRELRQARLDRIQNVRARQSVMQRALRVGSVEFDTAGDVDGVFAFRGVADPRGVVRIVDGALHAQPLARV